MERIKCVKFLPLCQGQRRETEEMPERRGNRRRGRFFLFFFLTQGLIYFISGKVVLRHRLVQKARLIKTVIDDSSVVCHLEI